MKGYMNRQEKVNWLLTVALVKRAEDTMRDLREHGSKPELVAKFQVAAQLLHEGVAEWVNQVDVQTQAQLRRDSERNVAALVLDKDLEKHERKQWERSFDTRTQLAKENPDVIHDLSELVLLLKCRHCNGLPKTKGCDVFNRLDQYEIPIWDATHPICPYALAGDPVEEPVL